MKKVATYLILILSLIMCAGCCDEPAISFAKDSITINIGDEFVIKDEDVEVVGSDKSYSLVIQDSTIAKLEGNRIIPLKEGKTILRINLKDEDCYCDVELVVTNIIYATSATVAKDSVQINMLEDNVAHNRIFLNEGCNEIPELTYDQSIISYNYQTGVIEAKKIGSTNVVVMFDKCNASFVVNVVDIVYTMQIEIEDCKVFRGAEGQFVFNKFPALANTYEFTTQSSLLRVDKDGSYEAMQNGDAEVVVTYIKDAQGTREEVRFVVTIIDPISDIEVGVTQTDYLPCYYYLVGTEYLMSINNIDGIAKEDITFDDNIEIVDIVIGDNSAQVTFKFLQSGQVNINITFNMGSNLYYQKSTAWSVSDYTDIELQAKWLYYMIQESAEDQYTLYLNGPDNQAVDYLIFSLKLDDYDVVEPFKVYDVSSGVRLEIGNEFRPTQTGTYLLDFVMGEQLIKSLTIEVVNYSE